METIIVNPCENIFYALQALEDLISISKAFWAFDADGMVCDLDSAEYIDIGGEEYRRVADNKYQLIN